MRSDYDMEGPLALLLKIRSFISKSLGYSHITGQNNVWQNYGRSYVENFPSIGLRSRVLQTRLWAQTSPTSGRISDPSKIPNGRPPRLPARNDQTNPRPNRKESCAAACDSTPPLGSASPKLPWTRTEPGLVSRPVRCVPWAARLAGWAWTFLFSSPRPRRWTEQSRWGEKPRPPTPT